MKSQPCDREAVALLASASLDATAADLIRRHLEQCPACREYHRELSEICASHTRAADRLPAAEVSARLRGRILRSIKPRSRRWWGELPAAFDMGIGRFAGAAALALLLAVGLILVLRPALPPRLAVRSEPLPRPSPSLASPGDAEPRLMAYRLALNRSPEDFDLLLAHEAARAGIQATPVFRPGMAWLESGL